MAAYIFLVRNGYEPRMSEADTVLVMLKLATVKSPSRNWRPGCLTIPGTNNIGAREARNADRIGVADALAQLASQAFAHQVDEIVAIEAGSDRLGRLRQEPRQSV